MQTQISEIAAGVYRLSTWVAQVAPPAGFTFNQFLIDGEEPMLFHCGQRRLFPLLAEAVGRVMPVERLRWIGFGHVEADECGAMNQWLAAAPQAQVVHGALGCEVSINDYADRPPRPLAEGEVLDIGGRRMRWITTPHVPHGWEAGVFFEETTKTLFCGDLLTHVGDGPPLTDDDVLGPALEAERMFRAMTLAPGTAAILRGLAELKPATLAIMHGSSLRGDGAAALEGLASFCEREARELA
ncbi:MAG TPA: MBL fold metallo-hydrolase [Phenylobacterium sp.]|uniref:MBL fold metallo-hydrolase n=1 Tax=Phenylobacterium sp. TaxID=1871053 RepID=UPI002B49C923|nr:MBL fold metallo-hydrolase [Phenylobacterium sp.]HKR88061.1 MBL fold metallo-hydrolase [Phenylobacterium sp.]